MPDGTRHAVPVHARVLGSLLGDEDANPVAFDRLDGGAGALPL